MTMTKTNAYMLARLADCGEPDSQESPGAKFLQLVASDLEDVRERIEAGEDQSDVIFEIADSSVPVYTHERWQTFVDLAAYQEDVSSYGDLGDDLTAAAGVALLMIADRLLSVLIEDTED